MTLLRHAKASSFAHASRWRGPETRSRNMEIVGIVMLGSIALYILQQFDPEV
jgi:hypothetical protein